MTETNQPFPSNTAQSTAAPFLDHLDVRVVVFSLRDDRLQVLLASSHKTGSPKSPSFLWELPGSPVPANQSLEETAIQCVLRLTGLREAYLEQLYTYGELRGCPRLRHIHRNSRRAGWSRWSILPLFLLGPAKPWIHIL